MARRCVARIVACVLALATGRLPAAGLPAVATVHAEALAAPWLFVSDLHFDPFADPSLVDRLASTPSAAWDGVFATGEHHGAGIGHDTDAPLLRWSLDAMRRADPEPPVVLIAGDSLAHHFRARFLATRHLASGDPAIVERAYDAFVDATIAYLAHVFDVAFPHARFLITLGNNDGYCGDYESTPGSPFLLHLARAWKPLVDRGGAVPDFVRSFRRDGTYAARLPLPADVRVLVTNSVFWSPAYGNVCAHNDWHQRGDEHAWMVRTLRASPPAARWWMLTHIPPGIDVFGSLLDGRTETMYTPNALHDLERLRPPGGRPFELIVAGHTHSSAFRVLPTVAGDVPVAIVPSVTPVSGGDPAFALGDVDARGELTDLRVWAGRQPIGGGTPAWAPSYDFDAAFGVTRFDAPSLRRARDELEVALPSRARYYGVGIESGGLAGALEFAIWRREWCAIVVGDPAAYRRCTRSRR